jgi:hypothetical protein
MRTIELSEGINYHRRRFFGAAATIIAAARVCMIGAANAQTSKTKLAGVPPV